MEERKSDSGQRPAPDPRRKKAGALAAVLAGAWLTQMAAMIFSKPGGKKK